MRPPAHPDIAGATPFSPAEFADRFDRLRGALDERRLDALLVTAQSNFDYFTGFVVAHPWVSLSRNVVAILTRDGQATMILPSFLEGEARPGSWIDDVRLHQTIGAAPVAAIAKAAHALGLGGARIGAELGREQRLNLSQVDVEQLQRALAPAVLVDAADAIWDVRMRKSAAEIECLRCGCAITARVFERIFAELEEGVSEREIAHRVRQLMLEEGADRPGWVMMTSGPGEYHRTFGTPRDRAVQRNDMVFMDLSVIVHGYAADFGRAGVIGGQTAPQREAQAATIAATDAAIAVMGPGVSVATVATAAIESLERSGFPLRAPGRIGHGLGLLSTEPPDISTSDDTVLQPGMVVTIEPTIIRDDGMFQSEHDIAVTDTGCDVLSASSPAHLRDLPATGAG